MEASTKQQRTNTGTAAQACRRRHAAGRVTIGLIAAIACLGCLNEAASAQNTAQRNALAHLGRARAYDTVPGGVEGSSTSLNQPGGLAFDTTGNLYIADTDNDLVRKVDLNGIITTVAGTGAQGFGGDGGPATSATLDSPAGIVLDATGNLFIADAHNHRVRMVSAGTGIISTIAGNGTAGFAGDGGSATDAELNLPMAVAVDSKGNIYLADVNNHRIREVSAGTISTVAGNGDQTYSGDGGPATSAGLDSPYGIAVDAAFNLYIGDTHNQRIRKVTYSTGIIDTVAGNGTLGLPAAGSATSTALANPRGVAVDNVGNLYIADSANNQIRMVSNGNVTTVAGDGSQGFSGDTGISTSASLNTPLAVAVSGASVAFADTQNDRVRQATGGGVGTIAGQPPAQAESLTIAGAPSVVYGTGSVMASLANATSPTGLILFYDGVGTNLPLIGSVPLAGSSATLSTAHIGAGTHRLVASYAGDANNASVSSGIFVLSVAPVQLDATAAAVNLLYGQPIPSLSGTLANVLPQDAGNVTASFSTGATSTSAPGNYPISASLAGPAAGNYTVAMAPTSGAVNIAKAPAAIVLSLSNQTPVFQTALTLTANVTSTTSGTPGGTVSFYDGNTLLNAAPAPITGGKATLTLSGMEVGPHTLTATYSGDTNFLNGAAQTPLVATVLAPGFTITASPATQTVLPLHSANYTLTLTPVNAAFLYPVTLSADGLPAGVTASFSPASIAVGAPTSTVTLTLSADGNARMQHGSQPFHGIPAALALLMLPLAFSRRARRTLRQMDIGGKALIALFALALAGTLSGCGGNGFFAHAPKTSTITITATSGPTTRTTNVTLIVE